MLYNQVSFLVGPFFHPLFPPLPHSSEVQVLVTVIKFTSL